MTFVTDDEDPPLLIFRRADGPHRNCYRRVKLLKADRCKTVFLKASDIAGMSG